VETKKTLISSGIAVLHVLLCLINVCFLAYFYLNLSMLYKVVCERVNAKGVYLILSSFLTWTLLLSPL